MKTQTNLRGAHNMSLNSKSTTAARRMFFILQLLACALLFTNPLAAHHVRARDTSVCAGASVPLTGSPAGGTWAGYGVSGSTFNAAGVSAGTYTVAYYFASGASAKAIVTVYPQPVVTAADAKTCVGGTVPLYGTPTGFGGIWTGEGMRGLVFIVGSRGPGVYTATYHFTTSYGCTDSAVSHITVNPPPIVTVRDTSVCAGASVPLTGSPLGGTWAGAGVSGSIFNSAGLDTGHHAATYFYTDSNRCTAQATAHITVNPLPVVTASDAKTCVGGTVPLVGTPEGFGGIWTGEGMRGLVFIVGSRGPGVYTATYHFTTSYGCTDSAVSHVTVNPLPTVTVRDKQVCAGASVHLSGRPYGGTWSGHGVSGSTFNSVGLDTGHHAATYFYTDSNHCTNQATAHITVNPLPAVSADDKSVCEGRVVHLSGLPCGGYWSGEGVWCSKFHAGALPPGSYPVTYHFTNEHGCTDSVTAHVEVRDCDGGCHGGARMAQQPGSGDEYRIYPNPNNGVFTVEIPAIKAEATVNIVDVYGKVVEHRIAPANDNMQKLEFNLNDLSRGIYFVQIASGGKHFTVKMLLR